MRWPVLVFVLVIVAAGGLALIATVSPPANASGLAHPDFPTLEIGGPATRHAAIVRPAWIVGVVLIGLFVSMLALGYRRPGGLRWMKWVLLGAFVLHVGVFTATFAAYERSLETTAGTVLAFPAPTAWLMYALYPMFFVYLLVFVTTFRSWFWTERDEARFEALLERTREASR
ncbi:MAG: hypothetical protein ACYTG1_10560 [Planctomycetota bacterium]|jgi:uncharacterized membrane protein YhaH (DUF805 family)